MKSIFGLRTLRILYLGLAISGMLAAQRYKLIYTPGSSEGELLELIEHQIETDRKLDQIGGFLKRFPQSAAVPYLLERLQQLHLRGQQPDKVLQFGEQLLALFPDDLDAALRCQKAAKLKNDPALDKAWEDRIVQMSQRIAAQGIPPAGVDVQTWKQSVEYARGVVAGRDYDVLVKALGETNTRAKVEQLEDILKKTPNSPYAGQVNTHLMNAYRTLGNNAKALEVANKVLANDAGDLDALLLSAQIQLDSRANYPRVVTLAQKVLQLVQTRQKPDDLAAEDWEKRKSLYTGSAWLLIGNTYVNQNQFAQADKALRNSLNFMKGSEQTEAAILFYLGWSNYHMENYKDAAMFFKQCVAMAGPFAEQAVRNLAVMKNERRITE